MDCLLLRIALRRIDRDCLPSRFRLKMCAIANVHRPADNNRHQAAYTQCRAKQSSHRLDPFSACCLTYWWHCSTLGCNSNNRRTGPDPTRISLGLNPSAQGDLTLSIMASSKSWPERSHSRPHHPRLPRPHAIVSHRREKHPMDFPRRLEFGLASRVVEYRRPTIPADIRRE